MDDFLDLMPRRKRIALIAHDNCKMEMLEWASFNRGTLSGHELYATGTTGALLANELGLGRSASTAARSAATSRSAQRSRRDGSTSSCSSGTRSSHSRTIPT